jgi:hypothetical protein
MGGPFVEVGYAQENKRAERVPGDTFISQRDPATGRVISALSDGLGSGIKANVLATLTATMALKGVADGTPIERTAELIMRTLPVCRERKISYATFSIVDISSQGRVRIIEYGNPAYILLRDGKVLEGEHRELLAMRKRRRGAAAQVPESLATLHMRSSEFQASLHDRVVFFSDGVSQAGMGGRAYPFGWGRDGAMERISALLGERRDLSARELARLVVNEALQRDGYAAKDDISCGVIYFREPRSLLVLTGPPFDRSRDPEAARSVRDFQGRKIIAGGTTASLVARELGRSVSVDLRRLDRTTPPGATMEGVDLVTEGIITLGRVASILESREQGSRSRLSEEGGSCSGPAGQAVELFLESDSIRFVVGTRINEAHQDPSMPGDLEIRRNVVRRIARILEEKYLKDVRIDLI